MNYRIQTFIFVPCGHCGIADEPLLHEVLLDGDGRLCLRGRYDCRRPATKEETRSLLRHGVRLQACAMEAIRVAAVAAS